MPRRKLTEQEIDDWHEAGRKRQDWLSTHPEEIIKQQSAEIERYKKRGTKNLKKHQPVVYDINTNGQFVHVEFTRNNGERVAAVYELCAWDQPPASLWNRRDE